MIFVHRYDLHNLFLTQTRVLTKVCKFKNFTHLILISYCLYLSVYGYPNLSWTNCRDRLERERHVCLSVLHRQKKVCCLWKNRWQRKKSGSFTSFCYCKCYIINVTLLPNSITTPRPLPKRGKTQVDTIFQNPSEGTTVPVGSSTITTNIYIYMYVYTVYCNVMEKGVPCIKLKQQISRHYYNSVYFCYNTPTHSTFSSPAGLFVCFHFPSPTIHLLNIQTSDDTAWLTCFGGGGEYMYILFGVCI